MSDYIIKFVFEDLYSRDGLDMKTKQIITLTILAVLGNAGFPKAVNAIVVCKELFSEEEKNRVGPI